VTAADNCLTLVPTAVELKHLKAQFTSESEVTRLGAVELCGFGLVAAGIRTIQLIRQYRPQRIILLGIAGALVDDLQIGKAYRFDSVACYGLGAGCEPSFQTAGQMGWKHWNGPPEIGDVLRLGQTQRRMLLSCVAASGRTEEAHWKLAAFPTAQAEDMEGFAVAAACRLEDVPLTIVRGISNLSGDRDTANWQTAEAIQSAALLAAQIIGSDDQS
jgi:futalosine hydrolase